MCNYVGVDVAKASLSVALSGNQAAAWAVREFANSARGILELLVEVQRLQPGQPLHLVVEPTGGYEAELVAAAYQAGWAVSLVNPYQVRQWAKGQGRRSKTDRQDALLLAAYAAETQPPAQAPLPEEVEQVAELEQRKEQLEKLLRSETNRLGQAQSRPRTPPAVLQSLQRTVEQLRQELATVEQAIKQPFAAQPALAAQRKLLLTVPGVGEKVVNYLLVLLHRFAARTAQQGDGKALTAFLGLDPVLHESGRTVHGRPTISKMGDKRGRTLLYLGALGGIGGNNPLRTFYRALVARGKAKKLALVAAAHKILLWAWAVFRTHTPFDKSRYAHSVQSAS
jgi:transposase